MSMHIVAKFISAVCLALELGLPRMLQQWMRGPWWERTPHSCWHCRCLSIAHTEQEVAPTYLAVLLGQGATSNLVAPNPFLKDWVSVEGWALTPPVVGLGNEHVEQREMRGWFPCQHQQWMEKSSNLLVWRKGPSRWRIFFFCAVFELSPTLICDLYFTVVFYCCLWH